MLIDHDTAANEYRTECDVCYRKWIYEGSEIIFEPYPHFECPHCGAWITLSNYFNSV